MSDTNRENLFRLLMLEGGDRGQMVAIPRDTIFPRNQHELMAMIVGGIYGEGMMKVAQAIDAVAQYNATGLTHVVGRVEKPSRLGQHSPYNSISLYDHESDEVVRYVTFDRPELVSGVLGFMFTEIHESSSSRNFVFMAEKEGAELIGPVIFDTKLNS